MEAIKQNVYFYIDENGEKVFDTEIMLAEFKDKLKLLTSDSNLE